MIFKEEEYSKYLDSIKSIGSSREYYYHYVIRMGKYYYYFHKVYPIMCISDSDDHQLFLEELKKYKKRFRIKTFFNKKLD